MNGTIRYILSSLFVLAAVWTRPLSAQAYVDVPLYDADTVGAPFMRVYRAGQPGGCAVVACPGGGYRYLEFEKEGCAFAPWFNSRGITLAVLQYRLPGGDPARPLADAARAVGLLRADAGRWQVDPHRVGIMGSSAGGHLAATLATQADSAVRPDFQILLYPVITMDAGLTHEGSRRELLGESPSAGQVEAFSNERQVTAVTPPAFIAVSGDDGIVPVENSVQYYLSLHHHGVPAELHVYPTGGHGWGMNPHYEYYPQWTAALEAWLLTMNDECNQNPKQ